MKLRPSLMWRWAWAGMWFMPTVLILAASAAALLLLWLDSRVWVSVMYRSPFVLRIGPDGAREILGAIANSVLTLAALTFSITMVTLALASAQYSPRLLRNYMGDRRNQAILGTQLATYVYALLVLRTIRVGNSEFVPSLAITGAFFLVLVDLGLFVYFIHHVTDSIQPSTIVGNITVEMLEVIHQLDVGESGHRVDDEREERLRLVDGVGVPAPQDGYIQLVDLEALVRVLTARDLCMNLEHGAGTFVAKEEPLGTVAPSSRVDTGVVRIIQGQFTLGRYPTLEQDIEFGVRQIADIALKALSPAINDPTTAMNCLDHLGALLYHPAGCPLPSPCRRDPAGQARLCLPVPTFADVLDLSLDQIRLAAESQPRVLARLLAVLERLAEVTEGQYRRRALVDHSNRVAESSGRAVVDSAAREALNKHLGRLCAELSDAGSVRVIPVYTRWGVPTQSPGH